MAEPATPEQWRRAYAEVRAGLAALVASSAGSIPPGYLAMHDQLREVFRAADVDLRDTATWNTCAGLVGFAQSCEAEGIDFWDLLRFALALAAYENNRDRTEGRA